MTINRKATIRWKGYDPSELKPESHKRVWSNCDECGKGRWIKYRNRHQKLCVSCSKMGKQNPNYNKPRSEKTKQKIGDAQRGKLGNNYGNFGKNSNNYGYKHSKEIRQQMSDNHYDCSGLNNPMWKGGHDKNRQYLTPINQCIKLNKRFPNSEGHHIMSSVVIFIPKYLHQSVRHNFKLGKNMNKVNNLAIDYLVNRQRFF